MKRLRGLVLALLAVALGLPALAWTLFRMPIGKSVEGDVTVYVKKIDRGFDLRGAYFEAPLGNKKLYLSGDRVLYVSAEDWSNVWGAEPKRKIRYRVRPVLVGLGLAEILRADPSPDGVDEPSHIMGPLSEPKPGH